MKDKNEKFSQFEIKLIEFLRENKNELRATLYENDLSNYDNLDGLIDLIKLMKTKVKL